MTFVPWKRLRIWYYPLDCSLFSCISQRFPLLVRSRIASEIDQPPCLLLSDSLSFVQRETPGKNRITIRDTLLRNGSAQLRIGIPCNLSIRQFTPLYNPF